MSAFKRKKLKRLKRVCFRLKEARTSAGFTIDQIAKKTRIEKKHIVALEKCEFEKLPDGEIYRKQIIKTYLTAIGADPKKYLLQYTSEESSRKKINHHPHRIISKTSFHNLPALFRITSVAAVAIALIIYLGIQINHIVEPPNLVLHSPTNGLVTGDRALVVQGQTDKEVSISINGTPVPHSREGQFSEEIDLAPGINTITVTAKRKHGKTTEEVRHVILKSNQQISLGGINKIP